MQFLITSSSVRLKSSYMYVEARSTNGAMFSLVLSLLLISSAVAENPTVNTTGGMVEGLEKMYNGKTVFHFIGIPYAAPPVGELRFQRPRSPSAHSGIFKAHKFGPSCMQYLLGNDEWLLPNLNVSEDCLVLNVYVPSDLCPSQKKSVMVWIHGGGFTAGQGMLYDGSYLALTGDVIVVTLNYRLGVFGFLATGDASAPGNLGIWDQRFAVKWVYDNIDNFGGNKDSVTIFGESAGGISVGYHLISPLNKGLFKRAICESGTLSNIGQQFDTKPLKSVETLGQAMKCSSSIISPTNSSALVQCLQQVPAQILLETAGTIGEKFTVVLDNDLFVGSLADVLKNKSSPAYEVFSSTDLIAGTNSAEGGLYAFALMPFQKQYHFNLTEGVPTRVLCDVVAPRIAHDSYQSNKKVEQAICSQFTVPNTDSTDFLQRQARATVKPGADTAFIVPTVYTLMEHANIAGSQTTFQYLFSRQPSYPWIQTRPPWLKGANHAGELPFVFGLDAMYKPSVQKPMEERQLSTTMMKYWTNFAKTGNPNGAGLPVWQQYNAYTKSYMDLNIVPKSKEDLFPDRMHFWMKTVPYLLNNGTAPVGHVTKPTDPPDVLVG